MSKINALRSREAQEFDSLEGAFDYAIYAALLNPWHHGLIMKRGNTFTAKKYIVLPLRHGEDTKNNLGSKQYRIIFKEFMGLVGKDDDMDIEVLSPVNEKPSHWTLNVRYKGKSRAKKSDFTLTWGAPTGTWSNIESDDEVSKELANHLYRFADACHQARNKRLEHLATLDHLAYTQIAHLVNAHGGVMLKLNGRSKDITDYYIRLDGESITPEDIVSCLHEVKIPRCGHTLTPIVNHNITTAVMTALREIVLLMGKEETAGDFYIILNRQFNTGICLTGEVSFQLITEKEFDKIVFDS